MDWPLRRLERRLPRGSRYSGSLCFTFWRDPRKIVLARSSVTVTSGNHRARPPAAPDTLTCVHLF